MQWSTRTGPAAYGLQAHLRERGRPAALETTMERLAAESGASPAAVRDGIEGMLFAECVTVHRKDEIIDRANVTRLAVHARITLTIDWIRLDDLWTATNNDDDSAPSDVRWEGSPWACYRGIASRPNISAEAAQVIAYLPFTMMNVSGESSTTTLAETAAAQGISVASAVDALFELESKGALQWDGGLQAVKVAGNRPFAIDGTAP